MSTLRERARFKLDVLLGRQMSREQLLRAWLTYLVERIPEAERIAVVEAIEREEMPADYRSPIKCDIMAGEWRCRCIPEDSRFDVSINPPWVKACAACGTARPPRPGPEI